MRVRHFIPSLVFIIVFLGIQIVEAQSSCPVLVQQAISQVGTDCANMDRNSACYGFNSVSANFSQQVASGYFSQPGDRAELANLADIQTSPMNTATGQWGVSLMNVQANVPNALPGQGVVFVLLGDVQVQNNVPTEDMVPLLEQPLSINTLGSTTLRQGPASNANAVSAIAAGSALSANGITPDGRWVRVDFQNQFAWVDRAALDTAVDVSSLPVITVHSQTPMQSFIFHTGLGGPECVSAPPSVLMIQGPQNFTVDITANGAHIHIGSTILLRTLPNNMMQIVSLYGEAILNPGTADEILLPAGVAAVAPLDANGMVSGPWTSVAALQQQVLDTFNAVGNLSENLLNYSIVIPRVAQSSGVGQPCPIVNGQPFCPPPQIPFPHPPVTVGGPGQDLPAEPWTAQTIGPAVCPAWTAYHSDRNGSWDIYRLGSSPFGADVTDNLSQGNLSGDIQPSRSSDSKWVAFTSDRAGNGNWEIWIGRTDGREQHRITFNTAADVNPAWGPGNLLTFESNRDGNWNLYSFDISGSGEATQLTNDPASDINAFWEPDGQRIVFQSNRDGDWEIYELDLTNSQTRQLTTNSAQDQDPVISADGKKMAWVQANSFGVYDLWVMDLQTGDVHQETDLGVDVKDPVFSPDSTFVAFDSQYDGDYDVFAVDLATGNIKNVTNNTGIDDRAPTFRCNTSNIIYQSNSPTLSDGTRQWDIFEINPMPLNPTGPFNTPVNLTNNPAADFYPENTPAVEDASREDRIPVAPS